MRAECVGSTGSGYFSMGSGSLTLAVVLPPLLRDPRLGGSDWSLGFG
jgi:hypothetical protein